MDWKAARLIAKKELTEALRDRKTVVIMVLLPLLLYPLLFLGLSVGTAVQKEKLAAEPITIGLSSHAPEALRKELASIKDAQVVEATSVEAVLGQAEQTVTIAVVVPESSADALSQDGQGQVHLRFDGSSDRSREALERIREAITTYSNKLRASRLAWLQTRINELKGGLDDKRLTSLKVTPKFIQPVNLISTNIAPPKRQGGWLLGQLIPMLICVLMIGATFYPAIDLTAGEKERGTLQTLLTAPISPMAMVAGKYVTVVFLALVTGMVNLLSISSVATMIPLPEEVSSELSFALGVDQVLLLILCILLIGMVYGALMMAIAVTAKSFKEAQNYVTPVYLLSIFPIMLTGLPGVELTETAALIPMLNLVLTMKALLLGTVDPTLLTAVICSTVAWIALALVLATRVFRMESVLLSHSDIRALFSRETLGHRPKVPTLSETITLLGVILLMIFYGGLAIRNLPFLAQIHATQWGFILLPTLVFLTFIRVDIKQTLLLKRPSARGLITALTLGTGVWYAATLVLNLLATEWAPVTNPAMQWMSDQIRSAGESPATACLLFGGLALAPAICEEFLFRGVTLSALKDRIRPVSAVLVSSLLFSLYHLNPAQMPTAFVLGLILGWLTLRSGSIWPAVLVHALHNGCLLAFHLWAPQTGDISGWYHLLLVGPLVGLTLLISSSLIAPSERA